MVILGIGGILSDAAAALVRDGQLVAAIEQKKIARYSRLGEVPTEAIDGCLRTARVDRSQVDLVALVLSVPSLRR